VIHRPVTTHAVYLIVLRQSLIAQDLSLTINDHDASAQVIITQSPQEALAALKDVLRLEAAFVSIDPGSFAKSLLDHAIAARGGRAVLMGHEAEGLGPTQDWDVLCQPFTTETALDLLQRQRQARQVIPAVSQQRRQMR